VPVNVIVLVVAFVLATAFGLWFRRYNGHFRGAASAEVVIGAGDAAQPATDRASGTAARVGSAAQARVEPSLPDPARLVVTSADVAATLGERATLLQFSSAFCAPCRATRRVLADVATMVPGVAHIELDAESHLELVRRLGIMRTPTTFVLDSDGVIVSRASGAPSKANAIAALGNLIR
jgi:thiol-disulfide isomerase/thioredoxin